MSQVREPAPPSEAVSREDIFEVLSNYRRREVIRALQRADGALELGDLAEQIAARENEIPRQAVSYQQRKRVYTALQQSHLAAMDEAGAVHYDRDRGTVEPADDLSAFNVYLEVVPGGGVRRSELYLGLAAVCVAIGAANWAGLGPLPLVPPLAWGGIFIALFGTVALVQYRASHRVEADGDGPHAGT
jgi:hypothetical protein